tara:strand:+ start:42 stop:725 length:684 start_codon:yes stop_codon:yes gene_type:complete
MIVSIHQPQYLPWLPYFSKIAGCDVFVFLDEVQFQKNGLQNRNELKNSQGRFWLTIPISANLGDSLNDVNIANQKWSLKHEKSIYLNYHNAQNYKFFIDHIQKPMKKDSNLVDLNIEIIEKISHHYFNINTKFVRQSSLSINGKGSDLILNICKQLGAKQYLSGPGGKNYIIEEEFKQSGISIAYYKNHLPKEYPQLFNKVGFINNLSAIDFILNVESSNRDNFLQL